MTKPADIPDEDELIVRIFDDDEADSASGSPGYEFGFTGLERIRREVEGG